ncbi:MAG: SPOR domain-containing protein [Anaerolineales bacterium]|nr:SPOR domain-containing protein [Anaerolineales bacterium]
MSENANQDQGQLNPWLTSLISSGIIVALITIFGNLWLQNVKNDFASDQTDIQSTQSALEQSFNATQSAFNNDISALNAQLAVQEQDLEERKQDFDEEIERLQASLQEQQVALAQSRFDEEQRARRATVIDAWVPLLYSDDEAERQSALAVLFAIYPNEAKTILESVRASQSEAGAFDPQADFISEAIESAAGLAEAVGPWSVVINSYDDLSSAKQGTRAATEAGYTPTIYQLDGKYDVVVGKYPTKEDAQSATISIRSKLNEAAYVVNLNEACPIQNETSQYIECIKPTPTPTMVPTPEATAE